MSSTTPIKFFKELSTLPQTLEANSFYAVRVGVGFDLYLTNQSGAAQKVNSAVPVVSFQTDSATFPPSPSAGDNLLVTDTGDSTGGILEEWIYTGTSWFNLTLSFKPLASPVRNETGSTLLKGTVVYPTGAAGNKVLVSKASASSESTSSKTYGIIASDLTTNHNGIVVKKGRLSGLNTQQWANGTVLWLSTVDGEYISTRPSAPNHAVYLGIVVNQHPNQGTIDFDIQNGYELGELHDVSITSPLTNDVLTYDSDGVWKNKSLNSFSSKVEVKKVSSTTLSVIPYVLGDKYLNTTDDLVYTIINGALAYIYTSPDLLIGSESYSVISTDDTSTFKYYGYDLQNTSDIAVALIVKLNSSTGATEVFYGDTATTFSPPTIFTQGVYSWNLLYTDTASNPSYFGYTSAGTLTNYILKFDSSTASLMAYEIPNGEIVQQTDWDNRASFTYSAIPSPISDITNYLTIPAYWANRASLSYSNPSTYLSGKYAEVLDYVFPLTSFVWDAGTAPDETKFYVNLDNNKIFIWENNDVLYLSYEQNLDDLLDVDLTGSQTTDILYKSATGVWKALRITDLEALLINKADLTAGKIPESQLPSYVDDVLEFPTKNNFPTVGETAKIYVSVAENLGYRWTGSIYTAIGSGIALGETEFTAYRGDRGKIAYDHSQSTGNVHSLVIADIPSLQAALDSKVDEEVGKGLSSNDLTNSLVTDIANSKSHAITSGNPHNTQIADIQNLSSTIATINSNISNKVDKVVGKELSDYNFNISYKSAIDSLSSTYVAKVEGKGLSDYNFDITYKNTIDNLPTNYVAKVSGYDLSKNDLTDSRLSNFNTAYSHSQITGSNPHNFGIDGVNGLQIALDAKVDKVSGETLTPNKFTNAQKARLESIQDQVQADASITDSNNIAYIKNLSPLLGSKVDKVTGETLTPNKFTNAYKTLIDGLTGAALTNNYNDLMNKPSLAFIPLSQKGVADGVVPLNSSNKIDNTYLSISALNAKGGWDASTNTPSLINGVGVNGDSWFVTASGYVNLTTGATSATPQAGYTQFLVGDAAIYFSDASAYVRVGRDDAVTSVNGQQGVIVLTTTDIAEGTQLYFTADRTRGINLTGLSTATGTAITTSDTLIVALGKLQKQITDANAAISTSITSAIDALTSDDIEEGLNSARRYFTEARVRATSLLGFDATSTATVVQADTVLISIGKLQGQITDLKSKAVTKVNGIGVEGNEINIDADDIAETATRKWFSESSVLATALTGLSLLTNSSISATDSVVVAMGKLQAQITATIAKINTDISTLSSAVNTRIDNLTPDNVPEGVDAARKYFSSDRVRDTTLIGISFTDSSDVVATDTIKESIGKLQAQTTELGQASQSQTIAIKQDGNIIGQASYYLDKSIDYELGEFMGFLGMMMLVADEQSNYKLTFNTDEGLKSVAIV